MKKIILFLCLSLGIFCSESMNAQSVTTLRSQRDSLEALYKFTLDKYDSVSVANMDLEKKLNVMGLEIAELKKDIENKLIDKNTKPTSMRILVYDFFELSGSGFVFV